jgi:uncharacterized integral membrane protein
LSHSKKPALAEQLRYRKPTPAGGFMRTKILLLIVSILLIAGFTVLNVDEFTRISTLNLGFTTMQLPLGLVMLLVVGAIMLIFMATTLYMHSTNLMETRKYAKQLTAQRELADKAEASRFTDLRRYIESQSVLTINQASDILTAIDSRLLQTEKLMLQRLEQSDNSNAAYWGQHDDALQRNRPFKPVNTL